MRGEDPSLDDDDLEDSSTQNDTTPEDGEEENVSDLRLSMEDLSFAEPPPNGFSGSTFLFVGGLLLHLSCTSKSNVAFGVNTLLIRPLQSSSIEGC